MSLRLNERQMNGKNLVFSCNLGLVYYASGLIFSVRGIDKLFLRDIHHVNLMHYDC